MEPIVHPLQVLTDVIARSITPDTMRRTLGGHRDWRPLLSHLPQPPASAHEVATAVVEQLDRRGLVDGAFLAAVRMAAPQEASALDAVQRSLGLPCGSLPAAASVPFPTDAMPNPNPQVLVDAQLRVVEGPHLGLVVPVSHTRMLVGRSRDCDVALRLERLASRNHCSLSWDPRTATLGVLDSGACNGTQVDGEYAHPAGSLTFGGTLRIGGTLLVLERRAVPGG